MILAWKNVVTLEFGQCFFFLFPYSKKHTCQLEFFYKEELSLIFYAFAYSIIHWFQHRLKTIDFFS